MTLEESGEQATTTLTRVGPENGLWKVESEGAVIGDIPFAALSLVNKGVREACKDGDIAAAVFLANTSIVGISRLAIGHIANMDMDET